MLLVSYWFLQQTQNRFLTEIIEEVKQETRRTTFRPPLENLEAADYILKCMKACWHEDPEQRPDIRFVRLRLKEMQVSKQMKQIYQH